MRDAIKTIVASRSLIALALVAMTVVVAGGVTFGAWTVGGSGAGYSKAGTVSNLTMSDVSASTVADLYPGGTGDVKFSVTNPNSFAVTITGIAANGAATSDDVACTTTGVSFTTTTGLTQVVGAGATVAFTLAGKAAMSNASLNACQGDTFTLPVTLTVTATSGQPVIVLVGVAPCGIERAFVLPTPLPEADQAARAALEPASASTSSPTSTCLMRRTRTSSQLVAVRVADTDRFRARAGGEANQRGPHWGERNLKVHLLLAAALCLRGCSWSAVTIGGAAVDSYTIRRYAEAGGVQTTLANCGGAIAALTCTEVGVPAGRWQYTNQPVKASWLGGESARSSTVAIVAAPVSLSCTSCSTFGTTRYINNAGKTAASIRVALAASSVASDTVHLTLTDSASTTITATPQPAPAGSGTVDFSGLNTSTLVDGALTVTAWVTADTSDSSPTTTTSLVRDVVAPSASDIFGTNGGTAGTIDAADTLVYRFSEAMSPASILGGWTGSSTAASASIVAGDTITVTSSSLGSVSTGGAGYVLLTSASCSSSIAMSGSTVTLTLGSSTVALPGSMNPLASNATFVWTPSASATDQAGNPMATTSASESGGPKANF